ncbi:hypothetical protein BaRGS_00004622 [Batillaria attramentaria]|uniref:Uncharacterized protein n=1 Tax=Batillaria attramentaria TaxID=370345 RepID=A0ABD0LZ83_9CAEN
MGVCSAKTHEENLLCRDCDANHGLSSMGANQKTAAIVFRKQQEATTPERLGFAVTFTPEKETELHSPKF